LSIHPSGAEGALALAWAAIFSWIAALVVFVISMIGSAVATVQLRRRAGSTFNLVFAALFLAVSSVWAVVMMVLFFANQDTPNAEGLVFVIGPGVLMTVFSLSWFVLTLTARLRRLDVPPD
jgi:hypothetical protein